MLQLIEVAEVAAAVERPAARTQGTWFPLKHLGVTEEGVEDLPDEDEGAQQEVGNADPQDTVAEALGQLQPLPPTFVLSLEAPFVEKERAWSPEEDQLEVVLEAPGEEDNLPETGQAKAQGQEGLVHQRHHVVLEPEDAVVDVQLCQLTLVDADLVLLLGLHDPGLHFLPRAVWKCRHGDAQSMQVEGVDLPVAANVIDKLDEPVDPEDTSDDQDGDKGAIFLNPGTTDLGRQKGIWQSDLDGLGRVKTVVHHLVGE